MASGEIGKSRQARWRAARALRWASELGTGSALAGLRLMKRRRALQGIGLLGSRWRVELMIEARTDCGKFLVTTAAHSAEGYPLVRYPKAEEYQTTRSVLSGMPCPAINNNFREKLFKDVNTALNRTFYQARSPTAIDLDLLPKHHPYIGQRSPRLRSGRKILSNPRSDNSNVFLIMSGSEIRRVKQ
jgi:hypothetical protein